MMKKWLALALSLCLLLGAFGALAEFAPADEIVTAPVEEAVVEEKDNLIWTDDIAAAVQAEAEAQALLEQEAEDALSQSSSIAIDKEHFPDATFRSYVSDNFDNGDGVLTDAERNAATSIYLRTDDLTSIEGVKLFPNMERIDCWHSDLRNVDVRGLKKLTYLDLDDNDVRTLNASGCSALTNLYLNYLNENLTSVNVSGTALNNLSMTDRMLTSLNVKNCANLSTLYAAGNALSKIELTGCPMLIKVAKTTPSDYGSYLVYNDGDAYFEVDSDTKLVTTAKQPTSITLSKTGTWKVPLGKKKSYQLKVTMKPSGAESKLTWTSSNKAVATVSSTGKVTPKAKGTTKIKVKTANGLSKSVTLTVYIAKPTAIAITTAASDRTVNVGKTLKLKTKLTPSYAQSKLTWKSSNTAVATVSSKGVVTGKKAGTARITVRTANGHSTHVKVTVSKKSTVKYRALLVGEESFDPICSRNTGDVNIMKKMLNSVKGASGNSYSITTRKDVNVSQLFSAIDTAYSGADSDDVSLFFFASHGDDSDHGDYYREWDGALCCLNGYDDIDWLKMGDLAAKLKKVPGKVIVIIQTCGSGAAIYSPYDTQNAVSNAQARAAAFDAALIKAFADADPGLIVANDGTTYENNGVVPNLGDFRVENKFYVLTASRYLETSWGYESYSHDPDDSNNLFTTWLCEGIGTSGSMPADTNNDKIVTLNELFKYISKVGDDYGIWDGSTYNYQHVQVYPKNSSYKLFKR